MTAIILFLPDLMTGSTLTHNPFPGLILTRADSSQELDCFDLQSQTPTLV